MKRWFKRFLSLDDKEKKQTSKDASEYIHRKKNTFTKKMIKLKTESKKLHKEALQTQDEVIKMIDDITTKIVAVTPGGKDYGKRK